jgi:hypothetical protein
MVSRGGIGETIDSEEWYLLARQWCCWAAWLVLQVLPPARVLQILQVSRVLQVLQDANSSIQLKSCSELSSSSPAPTPTSGIVAVHVECLSHASSAHQGHHAVSITVLTL